MADEPTLSPYWAQFYATWEEFDDVVRWIFPDGVEIAGYSLSADRLADLGRLSINSNLSVALAAAIKQGLGRDRATALRDFFGVIDPLQYEASKDRRGGGGRFGESFVNALIDPSNTPGALMSQIVVPNIYRLSIRSRIGTQAVVNVLHLRGTSPGLEEDAVDVARAAWIKPTGPFSYVGNTSLVLEEVAAVDLSSINGGIYRDETSLTAGGTSQLATAGACALIQWNGQNRNRSARGRTYFGPLKESVVNPDGRTLANSIRESIENVWTAFRADLAAGGFEMGVLSRTQATFYPIVRQSCAQIIATQRRRIRS